MTGGLALIAFAIIVHAITGVFKMALDQTALNDGLQALSDAINNLAQSILNPPNPPADLAEAQQLLNDTGAKLSTLADQVTQMKAEEDSEDATGSAQPTE